MDTLLCVLLYLNVISPSGQYTTNDIQNFATVYSAQINVAENTPGQLPIIMNEFEGEAIVIQDSLGG